MDDRDAFGRSRSEDPLADMGWSSGGAEAPDAGPVEISMPGTGSPVPAPTPGRPAPPGLPRRRRRRPALGCVFPLIVLAFIVSVFAVVVPAVIDGLDTVEDIDDGPFSTDDGGGPGGGGSGGGGNGGRRASGPPSGLDGASMLRRDNLAPALARLRRESRVTRVRMLRVAADRADVIGLSARGEQVVAQADYKDEVRVLGRTPGGPAVATFGWSAVDPSAPARIARRATRGRRTSAFGYVVLIDAAGLGWQAYLKDGTHFSASADGRRVRRIS